jgi:hypothetical protein
MTARRARALDAEPAPLIVVEHWFTKLRDT